MATPVLSDEVCAEAIQLVATHGSISGAARAAGIPPGTLQRRIERARQRAHLWPGGIVDPGLKRGGVPREPEAAPRQFDVDPLPSEIPTADELLTRRKREYARKHTADDARSLITVRVTHEGPFGVAIVGDPHVDDDGCDIAALEAHTSLIAATEGLCGICIGDLQNNWTGRLARLWAEQGVSAREAWVLVEWFLRAAPWTAIVAGNHDLWLGAGDPVDWVTRHHGTLYQAHGVRLALTTPTKRIIRVNARHQFPGRSIWHPSHGVARAIQTGWRDHLLVSGHTHVSGYELFKDPMTRLVSHALQIASYKRHDNYAKQHNFPDQNIFVCPVVVVQPQYADDDPRLLTVFFDPEAGADYLTFLRRKAA